jgi:hypothetical protein
MKTHTLPSLSVGAAPAARPRPGSGAASVHGRLRRAVLRLWLRYQLDAHRRCLHAIAVQRDNDFQAERLLHRAMSSARSRLQSL